MTTKILILTSNPRGTTVLDIDTEMREIMEGLRRSENRDRFSLEFRVAVRPHDLQRALLDVKPNIVHFCGHGTGERGIVLENETGGEHIVSTEALADLFEILADSLECVILNACYSEEQAEEIVKHINYVIGMNQAIPDEAAIAFSIGFYDGLGAGKSIEVAYQLGCNTINLVANPTSTSSRKFIPIDTSCTSSDSNSIPILKKNVKLGIQQIYLDPETYKGDIWTLITPETVNIDKQHLITIDWGSYQWQQVKTIPAKGLLLAYTKRNPDRIARIITVAPVHETYDDGARLVSENTKIRNGYLAEPEYSQREDINNPERWHFLKQSPNEIDWQWLLNQAKTIVTIVDHVQF
ncbi:hypothetical protein C7B80_24925 [Cyanosarcina cf. burmensis CCALA 770]|nr:hypothetical protein C7B80_24925 [Cyanosarcina cf. burmensis CCALA 770]